MAQLTALRSLVLSCCRALTALPASIGDLALLENLDLGYTALSALPESVARLGALVELSCEGTRLSGGSSLSRALGALPKLRRLNLACVEALLDVGDAFAPPRLEELSLGSCYELRRLPDSLSRCVHLEKLHLSGCGELAYVPDVSGMTNMTEVVLRGCGGLEEMPKGLSSLVGCIVIFDDGEVIVGSDT